MSYNISIDMRFLSDSSLELIASMSCPLIIVDSLLDLLPLSASLRVLVNMFPSSKCENVITSRVSYFEDVAYGVYVTSGHIAISSE